MEIQRDITLTWSHRILFTRDAFDPDNETLANTLRIGHADDDVVKVLVFVDDQLPLEGQIESYFASRQTFDLVTAPVALPGGEAAKNDWSLVEHIWAAAEQHQLCRHSYMVAIGGGAILDLVGFAATTAHRGIRHVRMPTTTLSQGDGGVGVKNGVNHFGKKNWVGTFAIPHAVVNDLTMLRSLPPREARAGLIEAVKVALIRDAAFFERLEVIGDALGRLEPAAVEEAVEKSAHHHVDHIASGGDPFELGSARPLDFGHWAAHKLEPLSDFAISHGEAVAIGMAIDLLYAVDRGLLDEAAAERVLILMTTLGFDLYSPLLESRDDDGRLAILRGLEEFREHLGGKLTITLVSAIGQKLEVHEMDEPAVIATLQRLRERHASTTQEDG